MKRILPDEIYRGVPCSVVSMGCALKITDRNALNALFSKELHSDGYLSLKGMNALVRSKMSVLRRTDFKRGQRPCLRDFCHSFSGKAVVCLLGHFVYVEGGDYHSFFFNGDDPVVAVWEVA